MNVVVLSGRLSDNPRFEDAKEGRQAVARMLLIENERYKDREGKWQERSQAHPLTAFGNTAEFCNRNRYKGDLVEVTGRLNSYDYEKDGQRHFRTEVVISNIELVDRPKKAGTS